MSDNATRSRAEDESAVGHPRCDMPECVGTPDDETKACRDPSGELLDMCQSCLDDGWRAVVEIVEGSE